MPAAFAKLAKWEIALIIIFMIMALAIRLYHLDQLFTFTYDQGRDMYVLQQIFRGNLTLIGPTTGLPGVFLGPFMYYLLLPGFILGNGSPLIVVKWSLLVVTLAIPFVYFLLKPIVGRFLAWVGFALVILTPGSFEEARQIWNPSYAAPTLLLATYCLFKSQKQPRWLIPSLFLYGLALQTELAYTVFLAPAFGLWVLLQSQLGFWIYNFVRQAIKPLTKYLTKLKPETAPYNWKILILATLAFGATLLPQIMFELRNHFLITTSYLRESSDPTKTVPLPGVLAIRPHQMFAELHHTLTGYAPGFEWLVTLVGLSLIIVLIKMRKSARAWFLAAFFALPLVGMLFHTGNYGNFFGYYLTAHYLPSILILILALSQIRFQKFLALALLIIWLGMFSRYFVIATDVPRYEYSLALQMKALLRARELQQTDRAALDLMVPNLLPINYQYLSEWMSRTGQTTPMDFGITDHQEYILMYEPPSSSRSYTFDPWYKGWHDNAECTVPEKFGILSVERCLRKAI